MSTTSWGAFDLPSSEDTGDVWPLEEWLSREEALEEATLEGDTWHAAPVRGVRSRLGGVLGSLLAASRRVPSRNSIAA